MSVLEVCVAGIGVYAPGLADWSRAAAALRGEFEPQLTELARPAPPLLPAAERRRAPETVLFAAQAAAEACAMAGCEPAGLPCVFASTQGDLAITDYMCSTLAAAPQELSPTKFHNSVHNAAVGYWSIATGCRQPSTAVSAWTHSAGAGLLEAALQVIDRGAPVLLAVYDTAAVGALRSAVPFDCGFAAALVLAPAGSSGARLRLSPASPGPSSVPRLAWAQSLSARNASAGMLVLLEALAQPQPGQLCLAAGPQFALDVQVQP